MAIELPFEDPQQKSGVDIQHKRGNKADNDAHIGAAGSFSVDLETKTVRVHDGETAGGLLELGAGTSVTLDGYPVAYAGYDNVYTISNFDTFSTYSATTSDGTVSVSGDKITLTLPIEQAVGEPVELTVTINDSERTISIMVNPEIVAKPVLLAPVNGATGIMDNVTLTTSGFSTLPAGRDTQLSARFQLATDELFSDIVIDSMDDTVNLESFSVARYAC